MLFLEIMTPDTLSLLRKLQSLPELAGTRLVGGTALALQLGHRTSIDLDLFGTWNWSVDLAKLFRPFGDVRKASGTPDGRTAFFFVDGVKVDCVACDRYPWLDPPLAEAGIRLAGVRDIAAMKINAVTNRGSRKDFVDLACLLPLHPLPEMFGWYQVKYPDANPALAMRSLCYFADAETMPMPKMRVPFDWNEAQERIRAAVRGLLESP